ncbi:MAG: C4-type zinc ribbon domain-containing protein [Candidatus Firestonebacteria bacterium]
MKEQLDILLSLQELDKAIDELEVKKAEIPVKLESYQLDLKLKQDGWQNSKKELENLQKEKKFCEIDLESKNTNLKKFQTQLYQVKSNKEYSAIQLEIQNTKLEVEENEEKILVKMLDEDNFKKKMLEKQNEVKEAEMVLEKTKKECDVELDKFQLELNAKLNEREVLSQSIDRKLLEVYDRIRKGKSGIAIVKIKDGTCGACYMTIRPQLLIEVTGNNKFVQCESCSRILHGYN